MDTGGLDLHAVQEAGDDDAVEGQTVAVRAGEMQTEGAGAGVELELGEFAALFGSEQEHKFRGFAFRGLAGKQQQMRNTEDAEDPERKKGNASVLSHRLSGRGRPEPREISKAVGTR